MKKWEGTEIVKFLLVSAELYCLIKTEKKRLNLKGMYKSVTVNLARVLHLNVATKKRSGDCTKRNLHSYFSREFLIPMCNAASGVHSVG